MLSNSQIRHLIDLLHEDYGNYSITMVSNRYKLILMTMKEALFYWEREHWRHGIKHFIHTFKSGSVDGSYNSLTKRIEIYHFNHKIEDEDDSKYYSVFVLYHELRHYYQDKYGRLKRHDIEEDCHKFAFRMIFKYHDEIMQVLNRN